MTYSYHRALAALPLAGITTLLAVLLIATPWAVHAQGESTPTPDPASLAPSDLRLEQVEGGVRLSWNAPAAEAGSLTGYEILRRR